MDDLELRTSDGRSAFEYFSIPITCDDDRIIKAKYRIKALNVHPDKNPYRLEWANQEFKVANTLYHYIDTAAHRQIYKYCLMNNKEYDVEETNGRDNDDDDDIDVLMEMQINGTLFSEFN